MSWIARAEKLDKYKVRVITKSPFPAAIEYLAGPVVIHPNEYYEKVGPKGMNEKPVGSGPYRVTEHAIGKFIRLERNPDYFKDSPKPPPKIEKIEIRFIPDRQTQVAEILAGGIDLIMHVALDQANQLKAVPHLQVVSGETMRIVFLNYNTTRKHAGAGSSRISACAARSRTRSTAKHGQADRRRRRARAAYAMLPRPSSAAPRRARRATTTIPPRPGSC